MRFDNQAFYIGWIDCTDAFYAVLCLLITLCNGLKMNEYEVYSLTDYLLINNWTHAKKALFRSFKAACTSYLKSKQTNIEQNYSQYGS